MGHGAPLKLIGTALVIALTTSTLLTAAETSATFRAGAAAVDVTPTEYPVIVNGMFNERIADRSYDAIHARSLVLDDGTSRIAMVVVDNLMMPRDLLDRAKEAASRVTKIPTDRMLISATHAHSVPSAMGCLGSRQDPKYSEFLERQIVRSIVLANEKLEPARIGWSAVQAPEYNACRRWIFRPDRIQADPFGQQTVRAHMHPGYLSPNHIGPVGPEDPDLSLLAVQSKDGRTMAVLGNFAMHYFDGAPFVSGDFCGKFGDVFADLLGKDASDQFVGIMSQGTSGDTGWMDYSQPSSSFNIDTYTRAMAERAMEAYRKIEFHDWVPIAMAEAKLKLRRRTPDAERLAWAERVFPGELSELPTTMEQIYAREARFLHAEPEVELKLQALRIGELGITALPNEVFSITGLKLKAFSPLATTFNIELGNGAEGYIPPPEQHALGGYTTWPARTAGLEVEAEPKIVETLLTLLEEVSGRPRRGGLADASPYAQAVLAAKPTAYWRLDEIRGSAAADASGNNHVGRLENGYALYLEGPNGSGLTTSPRGNRAVQIVGGKLTAELPSTGEESTLSLWFWNGLPVKAREVTGQLYSRAADDGAEVLAIGGTADRRSAGRLVLQLGENRVSGKTRLGVKRWHHAVVVRTAGEIRVFLDGRTEPEIVAKATANSATHWTFGSDTESSATLEGRLDEIAVFPRALAPQEIAAHYQAAGMQENPEAEEEGPKFTDLTEYAQHVKQAGAVAYWNLHGDDGDKDSSTNHHDGQLENGAELGIVDDGLANFTGGRFKAKVPGLKNVYSVEGWFHNEVAYTARPVTGYFFSRGEDGASGAAGDNLGIGGSYHAPGRLIAFNGNEKNNLLVGDSEVPRQGWSHFALVRHDDVVWVYLNGKLTAQGNLPITYPAESPQIFVGGRNDGFANFVGLLQGVAVYDRVLRAEEVAAHYRSAGVRESASSSDKAAKPEQFDDLQPRTPEQSLAAWHVKPGYTIELVAAEPLVVDPVAIDWGADGKLWVAEMADYPLGIDGHGKPGGRVRFLEDTDADGQYDKSTVFLEGLSFPTGVMAWKQGVLVTAAPELFYAEDTDGDGRADFRTTLFAGFHEGNQQLRVNGLRWGLDNWIYCGSGSHDGGYGAASRIKSTVLGQDVHVGSRDFRFRPDSGEIDPQSGPSQFGRDRDNWGNWFGVQNSFPAWHYVLADHYLRRNPNFAPPDPRKILTEPNPRVFAANPPQERFHSFEQAGRFTSACSVMLYRDSVLFPDDGAQHVFTCEPVHNVVQHNVLTFRGPSFELRRGEEEGQLDFIASEDRWTRPVMVRTGPDGALWVVDMYRFMIEHPDWLPEVGKKAWESMYRAGDDRGRIYRVRRTDEPLRTIPRLAEMSTAELVAALDSTNGWQRDLAQRLLVQRNDPSAVAALTQLAATSGSPLARLHAACTLDGLGKLSPDTVTRLLRDPVAGVRRNAVRLAERLADDHDELLKAAVALVNDDDAHVRLQLAHSLGEWKSPVAAQALADLAASAADDQYMLAAVMSSLNNRNVPVVLRALHAKLDETSTSIGLAGRFLEQAILLDREDAIDEIFPAEVAADASKLSPWRLSALASALDGLNRGDRQQQLARTIARVQPLLDAARQLVSDETATVDTRVLATRLLLRSGEGWAADLELLTSLLAPQSPAELQAAAVEHLGTHSDAEVAAVLLAHWQSYGAARRNQVLRVIASRPTWIQLLIQSIDDGSILVADIEPVIREQLLAHQDPSIRESLAARLNVASSADRKAVLERFSTSLNLTGDAQRGATVFRSKCATCHKYEDVGTDVGPQLASLTDRSPPRLLEAILDPNRAVEAKYMSYAAVTTSGRVHTGIIALETGNSITLVGADGKAEVLLRNELDELRSTGKSLMPEGLEADLNEQDMADLLTYLARKTP